MDHSHSATSDFSVVPGAVPTEPEMAWSVLDGYEDGVRILEIANMMTSRFQGKPLAIHDAALSNLIRDIIKFYPGQNLIGKTLVFQEPYVALMHHMTDLESVYMNMISNGDEPTSEHIRLIPAFSSLLDFLRPRYEESYIPAQKRLSQRQPTVTFDDMWVLFKANELAYAKVYDQWIGCKIGPILKWPADPDEKQPARWRVGIWLLRTDISEDKIVCATIVYDISDFDGEMDPTKLNIVPCQLYDKLDHGARRQKYEQRGQKIIDILWGPTRRYRHSGKSLTFHHHLKSDVLVCGTGPQVLSTNSSWIFGSTQPSNVLSEQDPAYRTLERGIDPNKDSCDLFTEDMRIILSPILNVLTLCGAVLHLVHVDSLQSFDSPESMPEPILHHNQLHNLISLAERGGSEGSVLQEDYHETLSKSVVVALAGDRGVGKEYTANYIAWRTGRPLITIRIDEDDDTSRLSQYGRYLPHISKMHNAMILIRRAEVTPMLRTSQVFNSLLRQLDTMAFINLGRENPSTLPSILPLVHLVVLFSPLDYKRQQKLWLNMMDIYRSRRSTKYAVDFERSASAFLSSADMPKVDWNGHDINKCLRVAIMSAQAVVNPSHLLQEHSSVMVDVEHIKEAMNMAFASRSAFDSISGLASPRYGPGGRPQNAPRNVRRQRSFEVYDSSEDLVVDSGRFHEYDELSDDEDSFSLPVKGTRKAKLYPLNARSRELCIAELNEVEWSTFKTLGTTELFRSKRFYAIDVLIGEPQIWRELPGLLGQKRRMPFQSTLPEPLVPETNQQENTANLAVNAALPERIRVNSPAIIKAFSELRIDDSARLRGSFLLFRPYKVLSYYEKEFRNWTERLKELAKESRKHLEQVNEVRDEGLDADVDEMNCLLSFIDTYLKERVEKIKDARVQSADFDDLWFLFRPGNTVVRSDMRQAYRIVRIATTRHHIKQHKKTSLSFFKDDALVEFDPRRIFIECVYIDSDGRFLGPVTSVVAISYFKGERAITTLPIYPIEFSDEPEKTRAFLIERGQAFARVGSIGHMHYRGLTLPAEESSKLRDEVDSQVVIDFEEAFNRFPKWMPPLKNSILEERKQVVDPGRMNHEDHTDGWKPEFYYTQDRSHWKCIPECCSRETIYHDDLIDDRTRNDYLAYQANENSTSPSVAIEARRLSDLNDTLKDDDFLIMCFRVFGFVLRSRKWHQLDLADASPSKTNSDGFDQLILPKGHKELVTSMMKKHFRDRQSILSSHVQTDLVRGKGRGLIMLLHGVPGVGKTSTAECLAGVFNRPLFQITSGDLGITAEAVDHNLEENFSLANRWNCILLIDEADVFLAQRNEEDFVQNSLVAVFLRIMEYYSGVLFLTTNRVGVFDEAFSSRIHISLYYPPLNRQQTLEIFKKNWERILDRSKKDSRQIDIDQSEITQFAMDYFDDNKQSRWNGRQIRNAFQSALAMAEFEALDKDGVSENSTAASNDEKVIQKVKLGKKHFDEVARAYTDFVDYLNKVHGAGSARRARENMWRFDEEEESLSNRPTALSDRLKFRGNPMQNPPRNFDPGYGQSQYPHGYGIGHGNSSHYEHVNPPRGGGYSGSHEYHYSPGASAPRSHEMEQGVYSDHLGASGPSANYQPVQPQTYGTRTHLAPRHETQTSRSSWDGSSRDAQAGVHSYRPGEQNLGAATNPNIRWGGDTEAGGSQQGP